MDPTSITTFSVAMGGVWFHHKPDISSHLAPIRGYFKGLDILYFPLWCSPELGVRVIWPKVFGDHMLLKNTGSVWGARREQILPPESSRLQKSFKNYMGENTSTISATGYLNLPAKVETHFEVKAFYHWKGTPERVLYVTIGCVSDGYGEETACADDIVER